MKFRSVFIALLLIFCFQFSVSQQTRETDSLVNALGQQKDGRQRAANLNELFRILKDPDLDQAFRYAEELLALAKQLKDPEVLADAHYNYGIYFDRKGQKDSALMHFQKAKEFLEQGGDKTKLVKANNGLARIQYSLGSTNEALALLQANIKLIDSIGGDPVDKGECYSTMGEAYQSGGELKKAMENYLTAEKIFERSGDSLKHAMALDNIGYLEGLLGNFERSIEYLNQASRIFEELNNKPLMARVYESLGAGYAMLGKKDVAQSYFTKSLELAREENLLAAQAQALQHLGGLKVEAGDFKAGIALQKKGLELRKAVKNEFLIAHAYMNLGSAYRDMKDYATALKYYDTSATIAQHLDRAGIMVRLFRYRSECYEALGNTNKALTEYKDFKAFNDSMQNETKIREIEKLRATFDTERKEQQIAHQETEIALLEEQEKVSALQKWLLGSGLGLSLLAIGFGFYGFRQKIKRNRLEREKIDVELAFKKKELTTQALHLAKKNETLESLKQQAQKLKKEEASPQGYQKLITSINFDLQDDSNWENFARYFEEVHKDFNRKVTKKYPEITPHELRLMALLKMNLSSKEIANILSISIPGIKKARQRLRKKMNLSTGDSLEIAILAI